MSRFDAALTNFRAVFAATPAPRPALDLNMVELNEQTAPAAADVHRVRWELDRLARKRERDAARQKRADATPVPEFSGARNGQEI